eukprot:XP_011683578.1 PREDICTED: uncharacterized protein LOC105447355 [Strongylocentrotus purpuratus]
MAGRIELESDIDIKLGEPAYYAIPGNELPEISAMPYFCGEFPMTVKLNWERNTVLTFKVGGRDQRQIRGQVTRPDNTVTQGFCIKKGNGNSCDKVEKKCKVVIKESNENDVGPWYLTIWYKGRHASKASDRRTVNE